MTLSAKNFGELCDDFPRGCLQKLLGADAADTSETLADVEHCIRTAVLLHECAEAYDRMLEHEAAGK